MAERNRKQLTRKRSRRANANEVVQLDIEDTSKKLLVARAKLARKRRFWHDDFFAFYTNRYRHNKSETTRIARTSGAKIEGLPTMNAQTMGDLKKHLRSRASVIAKKLDESATLKSATDPFELIERWCVDWTAREIADTFVSEQNRGLRELDLELDSLRELVIRAHLEILDAPPSVDSVQNIREHVRKLHQTLAAATAGRFVTTIVRELLNEQSAVTKTQVRRPKISYGMFGDGKTGIGRPVLRDTAGWYELTGDKRRIKIVAKRAEDGRYLSKDPSGELQFCFFAGTESRDRIVRICRRFGFNRGRDFALEFLERWCASPTNREQAKLLVQFLKNIGETAPTWRTLEKDIATIRQGYFSKPPAHFRI